MDKTDVVVVGAGPAGLLAAREVASRGLGVKVLEEHNIVGVPNHCAGLLSVEGLARLGVEPSPYFVQNEITGGRIYSPGGEVLEVPGTRTRAYVVDRTLFDRYLAASAEEEGADVETGRRVEGFSIWASLTATGFGKKTMMTIASDSGHGRRPVLRMSGLSIRASSSRMQ